MAFLKDLGAGRWKVAVYLGKDADERQIRPTRTFVAEGKRAAQREAARIEAELRAAADRTNLTLAQATEDWWQLWSRRDRSPSTREDYRGIIDRWVLASTLAKQPVAKITTGQIDRWYAVLPVDAARVRRIHAVVVQILDQCVRDGELIVNPAKLARKPTAHPERRTFVSPEIVERIVAAAASVDPVRGRALAFAGRTGLRRGELAGLRWSRVDAADSAVLIDRSVIATKPEFAGKAKGWPVAGRVLVEKDTKAHQAEWLELEAGDLVLLEQQAAWQRAEADKAGVGMSSDPFLFSVEAPFTRPIHPDVLTRWHIDACRAAGVSGVRLHDLRHHHLSVYLAAGATLEEARQRARHKSIATTMGYVHSDRSRQRELLSRLAPLELPAGF